MYGHGVTGPRCLSVCLSGHVNQVLDSTTGIHTTVIASEHLFDFPYVYLSSTRGYRIGLKQITKNLNT